MSKGASSYITISWVTEFTPHSANILLAEDWTASLGDYGVLRAQPSSATMVTTTVAGTTEYMDLDYLRGGVVSAKTDVYSFGVVSHCSWMPLLLT